MSVADYKSFDQKSNKINSGKENTLIDLKDEGAIAFLIDFGISLDEKYIERLPSLEMYAYKYKSYEEIKALIEGKPFRSYNKATDIWAMAVLMLTVILDRDAFDDKSGDLKKISEQIFKQMSLESIDKYIEEVCLVSQPLAEMLSKMLNRDPNKRPTVEEILNHPFFDVYKKVDGKIITPSVIPGQHSHFYPKGVEMLNNYLETGNFCPDEKELCRDLYQRLERENLTDEPVALVKTVVYIVLNYVGYDPLSDLYIGKLNLIDADDKEVIKLVIDSLHKLGGIIKQ